MNNNIFAPELSSYTTANVFQRQSLIKSITASVIRDGRGYRFMERSARYDSKSCLVSMCGISKVSQMDCTCIETMLSCGPNTATTPLRKSPQTIQQLDCYLVLVLIIVINLSPVPQSYRRPQHWPRVLLVWFAVKY